jgi:putative Mn2+ efflux pump MntP
MFSILTGSLLLSLLHAVIPNHWLPVLAIGRKENWTINEVSRVTFLSGLAHALSTIIIGIIIGLLGLKLTESVHYFSHIVAPLVLILLGLFFIYQHHRHKHFHLHNQPKPTFSKKKIIATLVVAMFFSPCMEIEAYFLLAGSFGWYAIISIALLYLVVSVSGMVIWIRLAYKGIIKLNWHKLEHNAGIITGLTLIVTGVLTFYIH